MDLQTLLHKFYKNDKYQQSVKKKLDNISYISIPNFVKKQQSIDGTIKWGTLINKKIIETVYIPYEKRATLCISSQIGCVLNCSFCATGKQGFNRNLTVAEIVGQVWRSFKFIHKQNKTCNMPIIKNIVMMGMGEPLLNFNNVINAIKIILNKFAFNLSNNHVTISTSGIVPGIDKLKLKLDVKLAISLHAPNDLLRNKLMPINYKYNISTLLNSVSRYIHNSKYNNNGITIEYCMLNNINDTPLHAMQLVKLLSNIHVKINLIPFNHFLNSIYLSSSMKKIKTFYKILIKKGFVTTIRKTRGQDINAACGQLTGFKNY